VLALSITDATRNELRKALTVTIGVLLVFSPSYIADIVMRKLKLDIGPAAVMSLALFLIGLFLLFKFTKE
jgi:hypothetical protein